MNNSEQIVEIIKALHAVQGEMQFAAKETENPFFKSKYADLATCWEVCREPMKKHGLTITQQTSTNEKGELSLITTLFHLSGQWIRSVYPIRPKQAMHYPKDGKPPYLQEASPQDYGSAITYARRYCLCALLGIIQDDDDGNSASGNRENSKQKTDKNSDHQKNESPRKNEDAPPQKQNEVISEKQLSFLVENLKGLEGLRMNLEKYLHSNGLTSFAQITQRDYDSMIKQVLSEKARVRQSIQAPKSGAMQ